jgi:hypothetical protein
VKDWLSNGKLPPKTPSPMTARMLLEEATQGEHYLCSVVSWGKSCKGVLWLKCSCELAAICTVQDTSENRLALQNVPKEL